ncbi:hypothetical protein M378DRAFT_198544 [Amanita muscaria Koide BX008]|uniref:Ubiquitin-like domain-containing protein n=1 Tax=Amanita muscaria (strain Koide BX008) TaxID=946122 RepID=A0A0C2X4B6_AMAMK|nr:hypothetical protein M378DRAFT_198544 [Amanita muscaria Koide BX008]
MADQAEQAFAAAFLNTLSTQQVLFHDDYQQPLPHSLKRVPVLNTPLPSPAKKRITNDHLSGAIQITFKSIKPAVSYSLSVHPTDTISTIKSQLSHTHPTAPPADAQRLLLKGKALADNKLLKEYTVKDGDVITLVIKQATAETPPIMNQTLTPAGAPARKHRHQRIPSVVLSPSPSTSTTDLLAGVDGTAGASGEGEKDIILVLDSDVPPQPVQFSTYHDTVAKPEYWEKLLVFLRSEFSSEADAVHAFEDYLRATKASLTPNEIAKIRDYTGVVGMAGT